MLNKRFEQLVTSLGIKKSDLAEKIGFTQAYISMILSGSKANPSERFYDSLKREFNVNTNWLKNGLGDMFIIEDKNLTPLELELVKKYNRLPLSERKTIDDIVDAMLIRQSIQAKEQ